MMNWFAGLAAQVRSLAIEEDQSTSTGRRIQVLFGLSEGAYVRVTRPYLIPIYRHPVYLAAASRD